MDVFLITRPTRVMRGSSAILKTGPSFSFNNGLISCFCTEFVRPFFGSEETQPTNMAKAEEEREGLLAILSNDPSEPRQLLKIRFIVLKTFSHVPGARASSRHSPLARLGNGDPLAKERSNGRAGTYPAQPSPFATAALAFKPV